MTSIKTICSCTGVVLLHGLLTRLFKNSFLIFWSIFTLGNFGRCAFLYHVLQCDDAPVNFVYIMIVTTVNHYYITSVQRASARLRWNDHPPEIHTIIGYVKVERRRKHYKSLSTSIWGVKRNERRVLHRFCERNCFRTSAFSFWLGFPAMMLACIRSGT